MSRIHKTILESGVRVVTEEMTDVESASVGIWVNIGSRDENQKNNGISHFIEHLLFKGTARRTALDIAREIESVGGVLNAFTGREYTCFYAKVLGKDLRLAVDLLSDIFLNSRFAPQEIEKERMVVLQEIRMVEDTPDDLIHDLFARAFWKGYPLGMPVIGSADTIKSMTREDTLSYFRKSYLPHTTIITAAGNLRHKELVRLLKGPFNRMVCRPFKRTIKPPRPSPGVILQKRDLEQVHLCLGIPSPQQTHPDRYKAYLLNTLLGGGMSSWLFQEIREKRGLAYSIYSYLSLYQDAGSLVVYAGVAATAFKEVLDLILKALRRFQTAPIEEDELKTAKEQLKGGMLLGLETTDARMTKLAKDEIYFGRPIPLEEIKRGIDKVTPGGIRELARRLFNINSVCMVAMGPVSKKGLPEGLRGIYR